jgi:hypothetical protein
MRTRFVTYMAMGIVSAFLIVGSYAFAGGTFIWLAFAGGIVLAVLGVIEVSTARRRPAFAVPAAILAVLGVVMAILAQTLATRTVAHAAFGIAIATGILAVIGLWAHELSAEHDLRAAAPTRPGRPQVS